MAGLAVRGMANPVGTIAMVVVGTTADLASTRLRPTIIPLQLGSPKAGAAAAVVAAEISSQRCSPA